MSFEAGPGGDPQREFASLQGCFVEGSAEQRARERRIRRRALVVSIAVQSALLTLIVLIPLFGKPERIAFASYVPIPPYYHHSAPPDTNREVKPRLDLRRRPCFTCPTQPLNSHPTVDHRDAPDPTPPDPFPGISGESSPDQWRFLGPDTRPQPTRPAEERPQRPQRIFKGHIEPAMLIYRVEPIYPPLARQVRIAGQVELRAIIATDGSIQSLQVVSGHPLLVQSALDAVRQWRYRPTVLDGQPVEVDTYMTVIYNLAQ
ncbi:MAG TPA: energy transducer TonB [Candidatus Methylomirabilis sp.]|nr:energy transducer TonB [Candidatus Methylomirabilis sp.]